MIHVNGGNRPPVLGGMPTTLTIHEGETWNLPIRATDPDGNVLAVWADRLPPGATVDPVAKAILWTPPMMLRGPIPA